MPLDSNTLNADNAQDGVQTAAEVTHSVDNCQESEKTIYTNKGPTFEVIDDIEPRERLLYIIKRYGNTIVSIQNDKEDLCKLRLKVAGKNW